MNYKLLITLSLSAAMAAACSKSDTPTQPSGYVPSTTPIAFVAKESGVLFKSRSILTSELVDGDSFGVLGSYAPNGTSTDDMTTNFMHGQEVVKDDGVWSYSPIKYYPNNAGDKIYFFGYYPYTSAANMITLSEGTANGFPTITYSPGMNPNLHEDFMTASAGAKDKNDGPISFELQHQLTQVSFGGAYESTESGAIIVVQSVTLGGIYPTKGQFTETGFDWIAKDGEEIEVISSLSRKELKSVELMKYEDPGQGADVTTAYTTITDDHGVGLMLIPSQVLDGDDQIYVDVLFRYKSSPTDDSNARISQRIYFAKDALADRAGKSVVFLFRLNVENIELSTGTFTYNDWVTYEVPDITIN